MKGTEIKIALSPEDIIDINIEDTKVYNHKASYNYAMDMTIKETYQAVEGMYHNLNTLQSRSGNQLPFTSINYGTCTLPEGRMVTKALLDVSREGIGKLHKTSIFPCGIFQYMKGVNDKPGTPNYDLYRLALQSTSERLYPNYANVDWSGNAGYDRNDPRTYFSTMGCRTANGWDINGFGQLKDGRGNICPVTIIMPTLAMETKESIDTLFPIEETIGYVDTFMAILDKKIHEAKDMLIERFEWICSQPAESAKFMYENGTMEGYIPEEGIHSALKHGTLAIGQIGLAETLQILIGTDHTTEKGMELAKRIEQLFKDRCAEFKEEYKLNFGVYYTPAENLCYTAMKKFKEKYGEIPNVSDKDYFTNSIHTPVWKKVSPFEKIDIESQLTGYSSAGCITYIELEGGVRKNIDALETIVNYAMEHDIPYFAVNVPNDTCLECGFTGEFNETCPICGGKKIQQLRRVTGYLTGNYKTAFNKGKQQEVEMRTKHTGIME
jgi:ribonucleoside-triphosphate reductase